MTEPKTCQGCGGALDTDQRYCLNCGRRRGEPRVDFRKHVGERPEPEPAVAPSSLPPTPEGKSQRDYAPLAAAGGIAVLGIMLLIGVLIGRGEGDSSAPPPTQVLTVPADGADGGATASGGENGGGGALGGATGGGKGAKAKGGSKGKSGSGQVKAPPPEITASDAELEALEAQSPQEYSESSAKLPDEIATPGAAPPTDDKAPGGGSGGATIE